MLMNFLTIYCLFATPFMYPYFHFDSHFRLTFPNKADGLRHFELFVDFAFTIDIVLNFFKVDNDEQTVKENAIKYLK